MIDLKFLNKKQNNSRDDIYYLLNAFDIFYKYKVVLALKRAVRKYVFIEV